MDDSLHTERRRKALYTEPPISRHGVERLSLPPPEALRRIYELFYKSLQVYIYTDRGVHGVERQAEQFDRSRHTYECLRLRRHRPTICDGDVMIRRAVLSVPDFHAT